MKTSIIICTYNEEKTIEEVIISCSELCEECEVIVIDDGSKDNTETIVTELQRHYPVTYEKIPENKGKSWAMAYGVEIAHNDIILFFDADVTNIKKNHFKKLIQPIIEQEADMVLGQPTETLIDYRINPFRSLTGERAVRKEDITPILDDIREIRFGVETYINLYYQSKSKRIKRVLLDGLHHPTKYNKTKPIKATIELLNESQEIALTMLQNYDLIIKQIQAKISKTSGQARDNLINMQHVVNKKLASIKKWIDIDNMQ